MIYSGSPSSHVFPVAAVIYQKLNENYRCMYLNSPSMIQVLQSYLTGIGIDVADKTAKGSLVLSSETTLSANGDFDGDRMLQNIEDAVQKARTDGYKGLFMTGDMSWEFGIRKNFSKLLDYEQKLEKLFHKCPELQGICQYHYDTLPQEALRQGLLGHKAVFINDTLSRVNEHYLEPGSKMPPSSEEELDKALSGLCLPQSGTK